MVVIDASMSDLLGQAKQNFPVHNSQAVYKPGHCKDDKDDRGSSGHSCLQCLSSMLLQVFGAMFVDVFQAFLEFNSQHMQIQVQADSIADCFHVAPEQAGQQHSGHGSSQTIKTQAHIPSVSSCNKTQLLILTQQFLHFWTL